MPQKHTQHSCVAHPMYPELYKCVDGINFFDENNFIDSLGPGRDSNPDPSALKPSECTTTPSTFTLKKYVGAQMSPLSSDQMCTVLAANVTAFLHPCELFWKEYELIEYFLSKKKFN
jgi:hypothetical protein